MSNPAEASTLSHPPSVILDEASVGTLIGRAWTLVRRNIKPTLMLMILPTLLSTVVSILLSVPSSINTLVQAPGPRITLLLGSLGLGLLVAIISWYVSMACASILIRVYYASITQDAPLSLRESFRNIRHRIPGLMLLFVGIFTFYVGFLVIDFLIGFVGFGVGVAILTRLSVGLSSGLPVVLMTAFIILSWGALIGTVIAALGSLQLMFCMMPLAANATAAKGEGIWRTTTQSWRLLWHNLPKGMLYGASLLIVCITVAVIFNLIPALWSFIEMKRLGIDPKVQAQMPLHVSTAVNLWSNLSNMFLVPLFMGGITLFWYDAQVRRQGLDLKLWLERLQQRPAVLRKKSDGFTAETG